MENNQWLFYPDCKTNINISIYDKPRNFFKTIKNVDKRIRIVL